MVNRIKIAFQPIVVYDGIVIAFYFKKSVAGLQQVALFWFCIISF